MIGLSGILCLLHLERTREEKRVGKGKINPWSGHGTYQYTLKLSCCDAQLIRRHQRSQENKGQLWSSGWKKKKQKQDVTNESERERECLEPSGRAFPMMQFRTFPGALRFSPQTGVAEFSSDGGPEGDIIQPINQKLWESLQA